MASTKPAAHFENREYFYTVKSNSPSEIVVIMYSTSYTLVKDKDGNWINHQNNKFALSKGLLDAVVQALNVENQDI